MKKQIFKIALIAIVLSGCGSYTQKPQEQGLNALKMPCIVVAVEKPSPNAGLHGGWGSIIIKDATGRYETFRGESYAGSALIATYNAGDTIR